MKYKHKYIITQGKIRHYEYSMPMAKDYEREEKIQRKGKNLNTTKSTRSINRVKDNLVLTIQANVKEYSKFITLTTTTPCLDREQFLTYFKIFKQNFQKNFGCSLAYVGVLERQKKRGKKEGNEGSIHAHLVVFNNQKLDFKLLKKCWGAYGSIDIKKVDSHENLGVYMAKYLTKDSLSEFNKKLILKSRNLKKPLELYSWEALGVGALTGEVDVLDIKEITYQKSYLYGYKRNGEFQIGTVKMTEYKLLQFYQIFNQMSSDTKKREVVSGALSME